VKKMLGFRLKKVILNETNDAPKNLSPALEANFLALFSFLELSAKGPSERLVIGTPFPERAAFFLENSGLNVRSENGLIFVESPVKNREIILEKID